MQRKIKNIIIYVMAATLIWTATIVIAITNSDIYSLIAYLSLMVLTNQIANKTANWIVPLKEVSDAERN